MKPILLLCLFANVANAAILITPDSGVLNFSRWEVNDNNNLTVAQIAAIVNPVDALTLQYTATPNQNDSGPLAASYVTTFNGDISGGLIDYIAGDFVDGAQKYLLVKDGNADPAQYIFRLSSFTILGGPWDGKEDIILSGFWPNQGSISHISLLDGGPPGTPDQQDFPAVPEPTSVAIWLVGLALYRRYA